MIQCNYNKERKGTKNGKNLFKWNGFRSYKFTELWIHSRKT